MLSKCYRKTLNLAVHTEKYVCKHWFCPIHWHIQAQFLHLQEIVPAGPPGFYCSPHNSACPCLWTTLLIQIFYCSIRIGSTAPCSFQTNDGHEDFDHFMNMEVCSSTVPLASYEAMGIPTSLCSLFQCWTTLSIKKFILIPPWCKLRLFPHVLSDTHLTITSLQVVVESHEISPQPPFLQTKQLQLLQLLLKTLVF